MNIASPPTSFIKPRGNRQLCPAPALHEDPRRIPDARRSASIDPRLARVEPPAHFQERLQRWSSPLPGAAIRLPPLAYALGTARLFPAESSDKLPHHFSAFRRRQLEVW
jgi:hypothetical protein